MADTPKPNSLAVSWFYGEQQKGTLIISPKYQRNAIWSIGQKCFLIDSLISGCPIPQVYINIITVGLGKEKKTIYEVVDGQQRLRAILEFLNNQYQFVATTAKSYPVSDLYKKYIGKFYSGLPDALQNVIWDYPIAVQELRGQDQQEIQGLFRRLNYVVESLNDQELRHSQYFGEFADAVETLTKEQFWDDFTLFTRRDSRRMKDAEFVSELFVIVMDGIQDQQKTLSRFYSDYDVIFPQKGKAIARFKQIISSLRTIKDTIRETRLRNKSDFYGLFAAVNELKIPANKSLDLVAARKDLVRLDKEMKASADTLTGETQEYYTTIIEGGNKIAKRKRRMEILRDILQKHL
ncbi:MAG: hypothetical protein JWQ87_5333 [Candidatus Sulfotelmatobacter sp.]|nr:hypothetical protein [Candidatus Sulfotelmatobacter sp.]